MAFNTKKEMILGNAYGDLDGDGIIEHVILVGHKVYEEQNYFNQLKIVVQNESKSIEIELDNSAGFNPMLQVLSFTDVAYKDIMITFQPSANQHQVSLVFAMDENQLYEVFNSEQVVRSSIYEVSYISMYRAKVMNKYYDLVYIIDLSTLPRDYLEEYYNTDGTLKRNVSYRVQGFNSIFPTDLNMDLIFEIELNSVLPAYNSVDDLGIITTTMKWDTNHFVNYELAIKVFGIYLNNKK